MKLHREARKWYVLGPVADPPIVGTYQASFDGDETWIDGTDGVEGKGGVLGWGWLVAGPDFIDDPDGLDPDDTDATITATLSPLVRVKEDPALEIEPAPAIRLWGDVPDD